MFKWLFDIVVSGSLKHGLDKNTVEFSTQHILTALAQATEFRGATECVTGEPALGFISLPKDSKRPQARCTSADVWSINRL